jgi:hypothetical protein
MALNPAAIRVKISCRHSLRASGLMFVVVGIVTLLDVLRLDAAKFSRLMDLIIGLQDVFGQKTGPIPPSLQSRITKASDEAERLALELELPVSADAARTLKICTDGDSLSRVAERLQADLHSELKGKNFYGIEGRRIQYLEQPALFGEEVFANFVSANNDIYEAGMCLAFERGTACVMHLSRIAEVGLRVLAAELGVSSQNDWGKYLSGIEKELANRFKTSGARTANEQFFAEAHITLDAVRRAWRNPSMHIEKTYSIDQAEAVFGSVRSFMRHLATRLKEGK